MTLNLKRINISKGINLNIIETNKFKTNLISIYFIRPLTRDEVTKNALIPLILRRGTNKYKTNLEIERKLEYMYGSELSMGVSKKGERHLLRFTLESPSESYIDNKEIFLESIDLLKEIIYNPYLEMDSFSERYIDQEKDNLRKRIESRINDKREYAIERCIEEMCKNEKFSIYDYGYIEDLSGINSRNLYDHYKKVIQTSPIEIFAVGKISDDVLKSINDNFKFDRENIIDIPREKIVSFIQTKNMVYEDMDVNQGKLIMGYRSSIPYEDKLYDAFLIASDILGGGPNSKLFRNVREKESLAYYINSKVFKYKSIMMIDAGIDFDKFEKTIEIIRKETDDMKKGLFTDEDISVSKKSISTSIKSIVDSNYLISEFFLSQLLTGDNRTIDEMISDIEKVSKDKVVEASNKLNLDTIYFLSNKKISQ